MVFIQIMKKGRRTLEKRGESPKRDGKSERVREGKRTEGESERRGCKRRDEREGCGRGWDRKQIGRKRKGNGGKERR